MELTAQPSFEKVRFDQENDLHLIVTLKAPKVEWEKQRPPICVVPCLDRSGSMAGDKLHFAKQSILKLIDNLQETDYCGLVTFDSEVEVPFAPCRMTAEAKEKIKAAVGAIESRGMTAFSPGMLRAFDEVKNADVGANTVTRVIMFTDGHANQGPSDRSQILALAAQNRGRVSVSAFGYGTDADQELLADLARQADGNYAFIRNPDDAMSAFAKELGGLLSLYAQDIVLDVSPHNGHSIEKVVSDVDAKQDGRILTIKIPSLLSEEERHIVLAVKLSAQTQPLPRSTVMADVSAKFSILQDGTKKLDKTASAKAKIRFVKAGSEQAKPSPEADQVIGLAEMVQAQIEAEEQSRVGNYAGAQQVLMAQSANFDARGLGGLSKSACRMKEMYASHSSYMLSTGGRASVRSLASRVMGGSTSDGAAKEVLASCVVGSASNQAQDEIEKRFNASQGAPTGDVAAPASEPKPQATARAKRSSSKPDRERSRSRW